MQAYRHTYILFKKLRTVHACVYTDIHRYTATVQVHVPKRVHWKEGLEYMASIYIWEDCDNPTWFQETQSNSRDTRLVFRLDVLSLSPLLLISQKSFVFRRSFISRCCKYWEVGVLIFLWVSMHPVGHCCSCTLLVVPNLFNLLNSTCNVSFDLLPTISGSDLQIEWEIPLSCCKYLKGTRGQRMRSLRSIVHLCQRFCL